MLTIAVSVGNISGYGFGCLRRRRLNSILHFGTQKIVNIARRISFIVGTKQIGYFGGLGSGRDMLHLDRADNIVGVLPTAYHLCAIQWRR
jgi:hypothetical protein